jgi:hypothetical protein
VHIHISQCQYYLEWLLNASEKRNKEKKIGVEEFEGSGKISAF